MKYILSLIIGGALAVSGFGQTRNVLVGTNNAVVQPTNFWSADASNARTGLGLGTAATNPATAFQPSSATLSNLSLGNATGITNIAASNIVGTLSVGQGGTGSTNASDARTALGLGTAATNPATAFQASSTTLSNLANGNASGLNNITAANITGTVALASNITGTAALATNVTGIVALANGGTAGTNASSARSSLGATTVGANLFTLVNPDDTRFIRLNPNNTVSALSAQDMRTALSVETNLGTVTSVSLTVPNFFSVSTPTITSSGTFAITLNSQTSRNLLIAPNGGGIPAFRTLETGDIPSLDISKITGLQSALDSKLATNGIATNLINFPELLLRTNGSAAGLTNFPLILLTTNGNGAGLTNLTAANITGTVALASNLSSPLALTNGGTGATNAATARTNLGLGWSALTNTDATNFRNAIGLGTTNNVVFGSIGIGNGDLNLSNERIYWTTNDIWSPEDNTFFTPLQFDTTNIAATTRTNLGLPWSGLTNTNAENFRNALSLGLDAVVTFQEVITRVGTNSQDVSFAVDSTGAAFGVPIVFAFTNATQNAATSRTNLGLGWPALTNSNAGTGLVSVNTNGEVVSPTNFWQVAPLTTTFVESQPSTNSTTNITAARFLHIHSLNTNVTVTNTIVLPTNGSTFNGDIALIVHQGLTNSMTRVRAAGSTNDIATMTRYNEAIEFVYYNNDWTFNHNQAFTEPIYFAGTNAAGHAAESRTNLGLGTTNTVNFKRLEFTNITTNANIWIADQGIIEGAGDLYILASALIFAAPIEFSNFTNVAITRTNLGLGATNSAFSELKGALNTNSGESINLDNLEFFGEWSFDNAVFFAEPAATRTNLGLGATNNVTFSNVTASGTLTSTGAVTFVTNLNVGGAIAVTNAAETRTNLGIPLAALTNTSNTNFQAAVFVTNAAPTPSVNFGDAVAWLEITVQTNGTNASFRIPLYEP